MGLREYQHMISSLVNYWPSMAPKLTPVTGTLFCNFPNVTFLAFWSGKVSDCSDVPKAFTVLIIGIVALNVARTNAESNGGLLTSSFSNTTIDTMKELIRCSNKFSINLFQTMTSITDKSLAIAGYSVFLEMTIAALGTQAKTSTQIRKFLELPKNDRYVIAAVEELNRKIKKRIATNLYINNQLFFVGVSPQSEYLNIPTRMSIESYTESLEKPDSLRRIVFTGDTRYVCTVATPDAGKERSYYRLSGKYRYGTIPEIDATFVQLPCLDKNPQTGKFLSPTERSENRSTSTIIVIPNEPSGFQNLTTQIDKINLKKLLTADRHNMDISIPLMEIEKYTKIKNTFSKMGLDFMFYNMADYTNMIDASTIEDVTVMMFGVFDIMTNYPPLPDVPRVTNDQKFINFNIDRSFIGIVTMLDEDPLIITMAHYVV